MRHDAMFFTLHFISSHSGKWFACLLYSKTSTPLSFILRIWSLCKTTYIESGDLDADPKHFALTVIKPPALVFKPVSPLANIFAQSIPKINLLVLY